MYHGVTASHKDDGLDRSKHELMAYRTVRLQRPLYAFVFGKHANIDARITTRAVLIVNADAFAATTQSAVIAVIDILLDIIVEKVTCAVALSVERTKTSQQTIAYIYRRNSVRVWPQSESTAHWSRFLGWALW